MIGNSKMFSLFHHFTPNRQKINRQSKKILKSAPRGLFFSQIFSMMEKNRFLF